MLAIRLSLPILFMIISLVYAILIVQLPHETLGNPTAPLYFPAVVCVGLFLFSVIDLIQTIKKKYIEPSEDLIALTRSRTIRVTSVIIILCIGFTLIFELAGFLLSTVLFLATILFYLNGMKKWLTNLVVTGIVSFSIWFIFSRLLEIVLPSLGG